MDISIIIPFLNEQEEVNHTINSIAEFSSHINYEIILINDASDDGYCYREELTNQRRVRYFENNNRIGVAACRNMGVLLAQSEIILLLDAHMRFYAKNTLTRFLEVLSTEQKAIVCCRSKSMNNPMGKALFGSYIDFSRATLGLSTLWNSKEFTPETKVETVPCVLGAMYGFHRSFWIYLHGLDGLINYGSDELYLSIKAWMSGGKCLIIKDVQIGHLYRKKAPYAIPSITSMYNRIWCTLLTLPEGISVCILDKLQDHSGCCHAIKLLYQQGYAFNVLKEYYKCILTQSFDEFYRLNIQYKIYNQSDQSCILPSFEQKSYVLQDILLERYITTNHGLYYGKMGIAILLYLYSRKLQDCQLSERADFLIDEIVNHLACTKEIDLSFDNGLTGIAWGICFLVQEGFVESEGSELMADLDKLIFSNLNAELITSWDWNGGGMSIVYYCMIRISQDPSIINQHSFFFTILTQTLKHCYLSDTAFRGENHIPLIYFLYLYYMEYKYMLITDFVSFRSLYYLAIKRYDYLYPQSESHIHRIKQIICEEDQFIFYCLRDA